MANNPFDPPIIQVKKTMERGGMAGANKGFGSVRGSTPTSRPAPGPRTLDELDDVDLTTTPPTHGQTLVYDSFSGLWVPGSSGGGGGGGSGKDRRWVPGSSEITIDEFNDGFTDPAWSIVPASVYPAGAVPTYIEDADVLSVKYGVNSGVGSSTSDGATARQVGFIRPLAGAGGPLAVGDGIVTCFTPMIRSSVSHRMSGLVLSDSAASSGNTQFYFRWWTNGNMDTRKLTGWVGDVAIGGTNYTYLYWTTVYQRIVRMSETTWRADVSPDGINWILAQSLSTLAFEPTHVGFAESNWNTPTPSVTAYEFIRRVSGVA